MYYVLFHFINCIPILTSALFYVLCFRFCLSYLSFTLWFLILYILYEQTWEQEQENCFLVTYNMTNKGLEQPPFKIIVCLSVWRQRWNHSRSSLPQLSGCLYCTVNELQTQYRLTTWLPGPLRGTTVTELEKKNREGEGGGRWGSMELEKERAAFEEKQRERKLGRGQMLKGK